MASLDYDVEVKAFTEYYRSNQEFLLDAAQKFRSLVAEIINESIPKLDSLTIIQRVKKLDECITKFNNKYRKKLEEAGTVYEIKEHISDLIGIRIVCLYEDEISTIVEQLKNERNGFAVIETTDKMARIDGSEDLLGYRALHMDLQLSEIQRNFPGCSHFSDLKFEIQIRTIIQDAWSSVDHKIKYKKDLPLPLRRRINILSGLFELADREFLAIRKLRDEVQKAAQERVINSQGNISSQTQTLKLIEFASFLDIKFPNDLLSPVGVESLYKEICNCKHDISLEYLVDDFERLSEIAKQYAEKMHLSFKPFTTLRHILFAKDKSVFRKLLYEHQSSKYDAWLRIYAT